MRAALLVAAALCVPAPLGAKPLVRGVAWERSADEAFKRARREDRVVMLDFWAEWCGWCKRLDTVTYVDPAVVRSSEAFVAAKVNTEGTARDQDLARRYRVETLPTVVFLTPAGRLIMRVDTYQTASVFVGTLEDASAAAARVMAWERALARDASDLGVLLKLGRHLFDLYEYDGARELLLRVRRLDEGLASAERKQSRLMLAVISFALRNYGEADDWLREGLSLRPIDDADARLLYVKARNDLARRRPADARGALTRLLTDFPGSTYVQKARELLLEVERR